MTKRSYQNPDEAAMKPGGMHRKEATAGPCGTSLKGDDAAGRPLGFIPSGGGTGHRDAASSSSRVVPATPLLAFLASLARCTRATPWGF